jgi:Flp pilus assembly protein TadD
LKPARSRRHHVPLHRSEPPGHDLKPGDIQHFQVSLQNAWQQHQRGQLAAAEREYMRLLAIDPDHPDALNLMGLLCIQTGRPDEAESHIRKALQTDSDNPQSHYNLGIACTNRRRFGDAASHFGRAAKLQPGAVEPLSSQGNALRLAGKPEPAVTVLQAALRIDARHEGARQNLGLALNDWGAALNRNGNATAAMERFREALRIWPRHPQAAMNLGLTLEQQGDLEQAADCYLAAIRADPKFADPHFHLAHLRSHRSSSAEIDSMRRLLENPDTDQEDRVKLAFGLGFALESTGNYAAAFGYMSEGHRLQARNSRFSLQQEQRRFEDIRRASPPQRLAALQGAGPEDERPVFVAGLPRSGTTLAEQVLASHPLITGKGESTALMQAAGRLGFPFGGDPDGLNTSQLQEEATAILGQLTSDAGRAQRIVDTTPMNFPYLGLAAAMLPGARFIHCLRDPLDNGLSIFRQYLTGPRGFEHDLRDLGRYYNLHIGLLRHWQEALGDRLYVLRYERLVNDPESEIRRLLTFLDLPFDERCLAFHQTRRTVRSPSAAQVRQPLYASSIGAWRRYAESLQPLRNALAEASQHTGDQSYDD